MNSYRVKRCLWEIISRAFFWRSSDISEANSGVKTRSVRILHCPLNGRIPITWVVSSTERRRAGVNQEIFLEHVKVTVNAS